MTSPLRFVFFGSDAIALPLLNWAAGEGSSVATVVAVYTQPDRATGRGQKVQPNAIKAWALAHGLPVYQPEKLTEEVRAEFERLGADLALVMAYGHILREDFIATPRLGTVNLHASILPEYRGASPIQTAIACGERETGVSLMRIVRRVDAGPVAGVERVPVAPLDTAAEVETKIAAACIPLLTRALPGVADGTLPFVPQDEAVATYCRRLGKDDGALDFTASSTNLAARINGLFPWPACSITIGGQLVKVGLADCAGGNGGEVVPGRVQGADADGLLIGTGAGILRLRRLQRPGGRMLSALEFLRGWPIATGTRLESQPMRALSGLVPVSR